MKNLIKTFIGLCILTLICSPSFAQDKPTCEIGYSGGAAFGLNEADRYPAEPLIRAFFSHPLISMIQGEFGVGFGENSGREYRVQLVPVDYRFRFTPLRGEKWIPFLYVGAGMLHYDVLRPPVNSDPDFELDGWSAFIPFGAGLQYRADDHLSFELNAGDNFTFTDALNPVQEQDDQNDDSYLSVQFGLRITLGEANPDWDGDGLMNKLEKIKGTDPRNPDTDGDGLNDSEELYKYKTNPLKADTDGEGLRDGDEVKNYKTAPVKADTDGDGLSDNAEVTTHLTSPLKADTDGDGLKDGEEIQRLKTDALKADTDGDGLNDGDEINRFKTEALKVDTDQDGLKDGDEVNTYKTDPLKADTDNGTVSDGVEVQRGTDPLKASDDVPKVEPKKEVIKIEKGKAMVLEGIVFKTASAEILPESETVLMQAYNTLVENPDIEVEIRGYTDNVGKRDNNLKLSQRRADAVKAWLVGKGVSETRLTAKGHGPDNPVAPNDTEAGRQQNRRIEFARTK